MELSSLTSEQYRKLETAELMRVLSAKACAQGGSPLEYYQSRWATSPTASLVSKAFEWERRTWDAMTKAAVLPGNTTDATWAAPLATSRLSNGFVGLSRQASVLGQLPVMPAPFQVPLVYQLSGASMKWVGQGAHKPVTRLGLGTFTLAPLKGAGIVVLTREVMQFSAPGSEAYVQQTLVNELTAFIDNTLLSAVAATADSPPGILAGITVSADIAATVAAFGASRPRAIAPTWIVSSANLGKLKLDNNGRLTNYPVVVSPSAGANLILVDAAALVVADDGVALDVSDQALVQMDDAPVAPSAATLYVSLWQAGLVGIRLERFVNWKLVPGGAQFTATLT